MNQAAVSSPKIGTLRRLTSDHPYFAGWSVDQLKAIEAFSHIIDAPSSTQIMALADLNPYEYFLVDGQVTLQPEAGEQRTVKAGDLDAGFPLAHLRPSQYQLTALPGAKLVRVESSKLKQQQSQKRQARFQLNDDALAGSWRSHALVTRLTKQMRSGGLAIPPMPGIAVKIRRALEKDDYSMAGIAAIISADPAIAGRLTRVANSAIFGGQSACQSVQDALVRLGIQRAQNIVLTLATRDLFVAKAPHLKDRMLKRWRHAIDIAALCAVLAKMTPGLDGDRALLLGLLHEIGGLPVIREAEGFPDLADTPGVLDEVLAGLGPEISVAVLEQWGFQADFRQAAENQSNWYLDHEGPADYADVLVVAHLHGLVKDRAFHRLPRLDETPAFQKLALGLLSPQLSLLVLDEAKTHIQELKGLLS